MPEHTAPIAFYGRWVLAGILAIVGLVSIGGNWAIVIHYLRPRSYSTSMIPFMGGLCAGAALLVVPVPSLHFWAWVPPITDIGCVPMLVGLLIEWINGRGPARSLVVAAGRR